MASMNIFLNSAFSTMSLTGMIQRAPYVPSLLGSLNLFEPMPVRTRNVFVERSDYGLKLIPSSADGAPPDLLDPGERDLVPMRTTRLAKRFTLYAHEVDGIRAFGSETELMAVATEYANRAARLRADMEATHEFHRLGALQGVLLDADGVSVIRDYFDDFGVTPPASVPISLDLASANLRAELSAVARSIAVAGGGAVTPTTSIHALAGDEFFDKLVTHPQVERTYLNHQAAAELREGVGIFESFRFGGITWHNYRGTDDGSTIAIPTDEAKLFPVGARDVFKKAMAPLETLDYVGTPGQDVYMMNVPDRDRNMWTKGEIYSYPLYICQRPDLLRTLTIAP